MKVTTRLTVQLEVDGAGAVERALRDQLLLVGPRALAERAGFAHSYVSEWIHGQKSAPVRTARIICRAAGPEARAMLEELLRGEESGEQRAESREERAR